jgi:hypothetical protein
MRPIVEYSQLAVKGLFFIFLITAIVVSVDLGIFAASSIGIKGTLGLDNLQFGALQSMVFLGIIAGKLYMNSV